MFKESKEDLRSIQRYSKKCNVHVHARNKVIHIYPRSNRSFKGSATESEIISQLRRNDSITESKEADHVREKVTRPSEAQDDHLYKRQRRDEFEYPTEIKSSGQEQMSSEHSRKLTPQLLRDAPLNCPATLADEEEKNNRHRDSHNVNEKINQMSKSETFHPIATIIAVRIRSQSRWILNDIDVSEKWHLFKEKSLELANGEGLFVESHTQQILSLSHVLLLKPKQHCPLILFALSSIEKVPRSTLKSPIGEVELYTTYGIFLRWSNKQAEESKARKQAKQPDAIINEIDQLTDSEANCPECKNATHASEYMEELKIFCVPEILKSRVSRNGHFALRLIANMHN
ncbi:hypothetical protein GLOIN_2v1778895 [Rhizophagus irregularis DAOM 181602=DAOM 197198]|nr:hypothetical protein GLOIN_2v1778895 [Rhizophagus irregularis DAOM 181602=DAOM 197198]